MRREKFKETKIVRSVPFFVNDCAIPAAWVNIFSIFSVKDGRLSKGGGAPLMIREMKLSVSSSRVF